MQIQFIKPEESRYAEMASILEPVVKKIFPDCKPFVFPDWLLNQKKCLVYEKEGAIVLAFLWPEQASLEFIYELLQTKAKWEQFTSAFAKHSKISVAVFGEKIPASALKVFSLEEEFKVFELFYVSEENKVFVKDLSKKRKEIAPEIKAPAENFVKQDASLSSFFYKMGKLSEEELSRFLDMESDLNQMNL